MHFELFTLEEVIDIHDTILNPGELEGMVGGKSLDGALSRVQFRITYGLIKDVFDLAATYAVVIARGHVFNDANKRTAYLAMHTCLKVHGVDMYFENTDVADVIINVAQGIVDEHELATWLRMKRIETLERGLDAGM